MNLSPDVYLTMVSATIVLLLLLVAIVSLLFTYQNRRIHHRIELKTLKDEYEKETLKTQLEIKEQTLLNVSQEIHDNIGQLLSLANLSLSSIDHDDPIHSKKTVDNALGLISKSISDLRNLSKTLDPNNISDAGLVSCLQFELELLEKTHLYRTSFKLIGEEKDIPSSKQLLVYRVFQEAINNIIKHSKATLVDVSVNYLQEKLVIYIADNGIGFMPTDHKDSNIAKRGSGLRNMQNRIRLINGEFSISSSTSEGTKICLTIPLNPTTEDQL